jgi:hypothetical protein
VKKRLYFPDSLTPSLPFALPAPQLKGEKVVVKVQRPGLKELFDIDLKNVRVLAQFLQKVGPGRKGGRKRHRHRHRHRQRHRVGAVLGWAQHVRGCRAAVSSPSCSAQPRLYLRHSPQHWDTRTGLCRSGRGGQSSACDTHGLVVPLVHSKTATQQSH